VVVHNPEIELREDEALVSGEAIPLQRLGVVLRHPLALGVAEAEIVLRKRGITSAGKKASRSTKQGLISSYIHHGGQLGVLVEVNPATV
jgi:hypothetical protein